MSVGRGTLNKVMIIGRVGQDPELKYTPSGAAVTNFSVATNMVWKDQDGNNQEKTEWHRVVVWRKQAENAGQYLKKGTRVYVEGRLQTRSWQDQNGVTRYITEIVADVFQMLESKGERDVGAMPASSAPPSDEAVEAPEITSEEGDDLPF